MPGPTCVLLIEKAAVRTSTEATLVLPTMVPSNQVPGRIVNVENQIRTICGGAFGFAIGAVGIGCGNWLETVRFVGTETGLLEQPAITKMNAPLSTV